MIDWLGSPLKVRLRDKVRVRAKVRVEVNPNLNPNLIPNLEGWRDHNQSIMGVGN